MEGAAQLINAIQTRPKDVAQVSTTKKDFQLAAGETASIKCKADAGHFDKPTPMVFEPDEHQPWPAGITINESLITLPAGAATRVRIPITNETRHPITLSGRLHLGRLTAVISITPLPVNLVMSQTQPVKQAQERKEEHIDPPTMSQYPGEAHLEGILSAMDLTHLTEEQQCKMTKML